MSHAGGSWAVRAVWLQGSLEPGETLPLKLKWILRREFWPQFQNLLKQGTEVRAHRAPGALRVLVMALLMQQSFPVQIHKGYLDDPRNTDNAWVETVAISVHFDNQNDVEMKRLNSVRASCLCSSQRWLLAGVGQVNPLSKADPSEQTAQAAIVPGGVPEPWA